jgi:hypothetical protein
VKARQLGQIFVRQPFLLSDAMQDDGEGFGDFQAAILVASIGI